jgi:hypothetical protein
MAKYSSKPMTVNRPAQDIFDRFSDLSVMERKLSELPADQLAKVGEVKFEKDSIAIATPQVGEIKFQVMERVSPSKIVFGSPSSPVPMSMTLELTPVDASQTQVVTSIDVQIPAMLRPLVGGKLQEAADKFSQLMAQLSH